MKKLLGLLGAAGLVATTSATVVACGNKASDVTLSANGLSKPFVVKAKKITAYGTITTKLAEKSVLKVKIEAGTQKAGEVTIIVSTSAEKLTNKNVKETIDVMFKAKGDKAEKKVASVSVTIQKKEASKKVKLDEVTLSLKATNDTTDDQVIEALKSLQGLSGLVKEDVKIDKKPATQSAAGSITITAETKSILVEGSKTLEIDKLPTDQKVDLAEITINFEPTNDTTDDQVIEALKVVQGLSGLVKEDVKIDKKPATQSAAGSITITAETKSSLVKNEKTFVIEN